MVSHHKKSPPFGRIFVSFSYRVVKGGVPRGGGSLILPNDSLRFPNLP